MFSQHPRKHREYQCLLNMLVKVSSLIFSINFNFANLNTLSKYIFKQNFISEEEKLSVITSKYFISLNNLYLRFRINLWAHVYINERKNVTQWINKVKIRIIFISILLKKEKRIFCSGLTFRFLYVHMFLCVLKLFFRPGFVLVVSCSSETYIHFKRLFDVQRLER